MSKELIEAIKQLEVERGLNYATVIEALKSALLSAYRKYFKDEEANVRIDIDEESGDIKVIAGREKVVEGKKEIVEEEVTPKDFGRIAAQTAKQVVLQKIREAEREKLFQEFVGKEGELVTGIVQQSDYRFTLLDLGNTEALLPPSEQVSGERYKHGMRLKAYIVEVRKSTKEPQVIVSRTHPGLVKRLFELEVPEIQQGIVEIRVVAREPGYRTKIAVYSRDKNVDPVGACVGPKGSRVKMVVHELKGEKIDVIPWNENPAQLIANALSPAKVSKVRINEAEKTALVIVPDDQLSLAIGKEGQNARLAAKLTGWKVDIKSESQLAEEEKEEKIGKKEKQSQTEKKTSTDEKIAICQALTAKGTTCKNKAVMGSNFCKRHQGYADEKN